MFNFLFELVVKQYLIKTTMWLINDSQNTYELHDSGKVLELAPGSCIIVYDPTGCYLTHKGKVHIRWRQCKCKQLCSHTGWRGETGTVLVNIIATVGCKKNLVIDSWATKGIDHNAVKKEHD